MFTFPDIETRLQALEKALMESTHFQLQKAFSPFLSFSSQEQTYLALLDPGSHIWEQKIQ